MRLPGFICNVFADMAESYMAKHPVSIPIPHARDPYMLRWYVIPRNRFFNIYLHKFLRSDDDRALHDHPWWNCSLLLRNDYIEVVPANKNRPAGDTVARWRRTGFFYFRGGNSAHRVQLFTAGDGKLVPVITLFLTGPKFREWGFYCRHGWRHWKDFTKYAGGNVSKGCD